MCMCPHSRVDNSAAGMLVAERLAQIEVHRLDAVRCEFLVGVVHRRLDFAADDALECDVVFFLSRFVFF